MKSQRQREGPEPVPKAPSPAPDDSTVLSDAPEVLNDPPCAAGPEMGPNQPHSAPPRGAHGVDHRGRTAERRGGPLDFRNVRSGVKEAEKDAYGAPSGAEQAADATTKEQRTVATCPCPEEAPKTVQDMLVTSPNPEFLRVTPQGPQP